MSVGILLPEDCVAIVNIELLEIFNQEIFQILQEVFVIESGVSSFNNQSLSVS